MGTHDLVMALVTATGAAAVLVFRRRLRDWLSENIDDFWNNFGGGPPRPMHPSPANDGALLRRRSRKIAN